MRAREFIVESKQPVVYHGNQGGIHQEFITPMWWTESYQDARYYATYGDVDGWVYKATLSCKKPYTINGKDANSVVQRWKELADQGYDCIYDERAGDWIPFYAKDIHLVDKEGVDPEELSENRLFIKTLKSEDALVEHAKKFSRGMRLDGVPVSISNRYYSICTELLSDTSLMESAGNDTINVLKRVDEFGKLKPQIGDAIAIINAQSQGSTLELWGFTDPKTITEITRDPSDGSILQFEFNNDPDDVWPRVENASFNGKLFMYSAFFGTKRSAEFALNELCLNASEDFQRVRNHITRQVDESTEQDPVNAFIDKIYSEYPTSPFNPNQRGIVSGEGEDQTIALFELTPSKSVRDAVELHWIQAYPQRKGVGTAAIRELQAKAREAGLKMTLYPQPNGPVSQASLKRLYKRLGFQPIQKGGSTMVWSPE